MRLVEARRAVRMPIPGTTSKTRARRARTPVQPESPRARPGLPAATIARRASSLTRRASRAARPQTPDILSTKRARRSRSFALRANTRAAPETPCARRASGASSRTRKAWATASWPAAGTTSEIPVRRSRKSVRLVRTLIAKAHQVACLPTLASSSTARAQPIRVSAQR